MRGGRGGGGHSRAVSRPRVSHSVVRPVIRHRRPVIHGGGYIWNGVYWVSPQGACYTKDDEGVYTLVNCTPNVSVVEDSEFTGGYGGTMESSAEGTELREGGPLNKKNLRDLAIGLLVGLAIVYVAKKYKLSK